MNLITTAAVAACEKIINKALEYDPGTRAALAGCEDNILSIKISMPPCKVFIFFENDAVRLMTEWQGSVDTEISGSLLALAQVSSTPVHNLKDSGVTATGDLQLLASLQKIVRSLDIDWEEILSKLVGDVLAHQTANLIRRGHQWQKQQAENFQRLTSEFVTEELQAIPSKVELEYFYAQVDELRLAADRLKAKLEQLAPS